MSLDEFSDSQHFLERPLPSSPETEKAILGAVILDNSLIAEAALFLTAADFYIPSHRKIFVAMLALFEVGSEINPILIAEELRRDNNLESSGGMLFLANLTFGLPHVSSIEKLCEVIKGKSILRKLIKASSKIASEALEESELPRTILLHAEKTIFDIALTDNQKGFTKINTATHKSLDKTYQIQQSGKALTGISTSFLDLDMLTHGWQKGDLIIIAGRPGMGKTAIALQMALHAALNGYKIAFFSLEMSTEQIAMRALCASARIDVNRYRGGFLTQEEWYRLGDAQEEFQSAQLYIDDAAGLSHLEIRARAMRLIAEQGKLDGIIVDHMGLIGHDRSLNRFYNREQEVAQNSRALKAIAKELDLPLLALSQLRRAPEDRAEHRPMLADLRESGAIEQDADVVTFVYRASKYHKKEEEDDRTAELIIAKQRNGPSDTVYLRFEDFCARFDNLHSTNHLNEVDS
jgi:replicative DNA helicase